MTNKIKWIIIAVLAVGFTVSGVTAVVLDRQVRQLEDRCEEQSVVIDSLLARRTTFMDVSLHVVDKSKFAIYGRYNKGQITVPSARTYTLSVDSVNVRVR